VQPVYVVPSVPFGQFSAGIETGTGVVTAIVADAFFVLSAKLVAVTATFVVCFTGGAVNIPVLEMLPAFADQTTAVLDVPFMVASNCRDSPDGMLPLEGEMEMLTEEATRLSTVIWVDKNVKRNSESRANNSKCATPALCGVPVTLPVVGLRESPAGSSPLIIMNEKGALPPFGEKDP